MENMITLKTKRALDFINDLIELETRYTTIGTKMFTKQKDSLTDAFVAARKGW